MNVTVTFRHLQPTDALRDYAQTKIGRLERYLHRPMGAHVILSVLKKNHRAEISLSANGTSLFADEETSDLYSAIDLALDKIERQVKKLNQKRKEHQAEPHPLAEAATLRLQVLAPDRLDEHGAPAIIRTRQIPAKPMSVEEAVMQMDLTNNEFFVFRSAEGSGLSVIYRRRDGNYGLIDSESA
jgi:putative sigma-54 modulation protein